VGSTTPVLRQLTAHLLVRLLLLLQGVLHHDGGDQTLALLQDRLAAILKSVEIIS
jgi:hypothetical protein